MNTRQLALAFFSAVVVPRAYAQDVSSAEQFFRALYAPYATETHDPSDDRRLKPDAIYDDELLALIHQDQEMMAKYEMGLLRYDPICNCQDWTALKITRLTVLLKGSASAGATVSFIDAGHRQTLTYQLVNAAGQWRVHDILGGLEPSLRQYLMTGLPREERELRRRRR